MKKLSIIILSCVTLSLTHSFADETFKGADSDGNGEISRSESQRSENKELRKYFGRLDKDGNGRVSEDEFGKLKSEKAKVDARDKAKADKEAADKKKKQNNNKKKKKKN